MEIPLNLLAESCVTLAGPYTRSEKCVFPFTFYGVTYYSCVREQPPWCATKVDENGTLFDTHTHTGDCSPECAGKDEIKVGSDKNAHNPSRNFSFAYVNMVYLHLFLLQTTSTEETSWLSTLQRCTER